MSRTLQVATLGLVPYGEALELQRRLAQDRISGALAHDTLLLLEHPPVVTLGRGFKNSSLPLPAAALARRGIELHEIERGGDVTYHGPGQLVGYPIFDLAGHRQDLHWYLRQLEETLIVALRPFGIAAERNPGLTGVWTQGRKIASIGIHVRQWVTWHGFALNVTTDLSPFELIVPCGIPNVQMTSIEKEVDSRTVGQSVSEDLAGSARRAVVQTFEQVFGFDAVNHTDRLTTDRLTV